MSLPSLDRFARVRHFADRQNGFVTALLILLVTGACSAVGLLMMAGFFWLGSSAEPTQILAPADQVEVMVSASSPASTVESEPETGETLADDEDTNTR